ncbi:hypothetical protein KRMM14A1004_29920 [Krasilnikovia sp. MM14-A1004]
MTAHERGDEHLILDAELGELGKLEVTLDGHAGVRQPHPLHGERLTLRQLRQVLPVHRDLLNFLKYELKKIKVARSAAEILANGSAHHQRDAVGAGRDQLADDGMAGQLTGHQQAP